jgi:hypothetical protein
MSFPNIPPEGINPIEGLDSEQVALLLLVSIAFEELGLAHLINVEAEKLQGAIGTLVDQNGVLVNPLIRAGSLAELLEANREVEKVLRTIVTKEMLLQFKFENVLDFLSTTTSTSSTTTSTSTTTTSTSTTTTSTSTTTTSTSTTTTTTTTTSTTSTSTTTTRRCGDCSVVFSVSDVGLVGQSTVETLNPPRVILGGANDTLIMAVDICGGCTSEGNNFSYSYIKPAPNPITQNFVADPATITVDQCILDDLGVVVGIVVSGQGTASGTGNGHVDDDPAFFTLRLVEPNVIIFEIRLNQSDLLPAYSGVHTPIGLAFNVVDCP